MKRVLSDFLLLTAFLTLCLTASAKPRSFKQAQSIAERQAQKLGIVIDQSSLAKAPRLNGVTDDNTSKPYFVFPNGEEKGFTVFRVTTASLKSSATRTEAHIPKTNCLKDMWISFSSTRRWWRQWRKATTLPSRP